MVTLRIPREAGGTAPPALEADLAEARADLHAEQRAHARTKEALGGTLERAEAAEFALARRTAELELARSFGLPQLGYSVPDPGTLPVESLIHDGLRADLAAGDPFATVPASALGTGELVPVEVAA